MNPVLSSRWEEVLQPHAGPESSVPGLIQMLMQCETEQEDERDALMLHLETRDS